MQLIEADKFLKENPCVERIVKVLRTTTWSSEKIHVIELICKYLSSTNTGYSLKTELGYSYWGDPYADITLTLRGEVPCSLLR